MKKFLIACFVFAGFVLHAQEFKVTLSKEFIHDGEATMYKIGDYIYAQETNKKNTQSGFTAKLAKETHEITLYKYDADMKEIKKVVLDDGKKTFGPWKTQFTLLGDKLLLFYYKYFEDETAKLFVSKIGLDDLAIVDTKELFTFSQKNVGNVNLKMESALLNNNLSIYSTEDKTKLLLVIKNDTSINSIIIDSNLAIKKRDALRKPNLKEFEYTSIFIDNAENEYFSYKCFKDNEWLSGIIVQNNAGKENTIPLKVDNGIKTEKIRFKSNNSGTVYVYSNYYNGYTNEGILLTKIDASNFTIDPIQLFPYPETLKQDIIGLGFDEGKTIIEKEGTTINFGNKTSIISGRKEQTYQSIPSIEFELTELSNGTIIFNGTANNTLESGNAGNLPATNYVNTTSYRSGPIINVCINNNAPLFSLIIRSQPQTEASGCIFIPLKEKLLCIYNDYEKNIESDTKSEAKSEWGTKNLVLVAAVIGSDGSIISKKKIADSPVGKNYFCTSKLQKISNNNYLIPIGRSKIGWTGLVYGTVQWAYLEIK